MLSLAADSIPSIIKKQDHMTGSNQVSLITHYIDDFNFTHPQQSWAPLGRPLLPNQKSSLLSNLWKICSGSCITIMVRSRCGDVSADWRDIEFALGTSLFIVEQ